MGTPQILWLISICSINIEKDMGITQFQSHSYICLDCQCEKIGWQYSVLCNVLKNTYIYIYTVYILLILIPPISQFLLDFPEQMMTVPAKPGSRIHIGIINKNSLLWVLKSMIVMLVTTCFETHTIHIHWENDHISQFSIQMLGSVGSTV
jgi:hypothetical protein